MKQAAVASLACLAILGLTCPPTMANGSPQGHAVFAVSGAPSSLVPPAARDESASEPGSCANALQQTLASPFSMAIVEASQISIDGRLSLHTYTLVGNGKRTLILVCVGGLV